MLKGLDASAIKYIPALSPTAVSVGGSSDAFDLSPFTFATLIVSAGSTAAATITADVQRSSASNGTFNGFGASVSAAVLGGLHVRSFAVATSATWHKVWRTATGAGSPSTTILLVGQGTRYAPVDQATGATSYSTIG